MYWLFAFGSFVLVFEFGWFYFVLQKGPASEASDVIVVFGGARERALKGFELANLGLANNLIVSPASVAQLKSLDKSYREKNQYNYFIEDRAATTFQNAFLVAELIKKNNINSVILVTADYHMPRSYFLLKLQLISHGVVVRLWPVQSERFDKNPMSWPTIQKKRIYNEMVELWGSMAEMVQYRFSDRLPEMGLNKSKAISFLRSLLLFDL